jgi:hypothetical protein
VNDAQLADFKAEAAQLSASLSGMTSSLTELEQAVEDFNKKLGDN